MVVHFPEGIGREWVSWTSPAPRFIETTTWMYNKNISCWKDNTIIDFSNVIILPFSPYSSRSAWNHRHLRDLQRTPESTNKYIFQSKTNPKKVFENIYISVAYLFFLNGSILFDIHGKFQRISGNAAIFQDPLNEKSVPIFPVNIETI